MSNFGIRLVFSTVRLLLTVGIYFLFASYFSPHAQATIYSYLVNDAFTAPDHPFATGVGYVWYSKNIALNYTGGKVFLSRSGDAAGEMTVGDAVQVTVNSKSFLFRSSQNCLSINKLQPVDITFLLSQGNNNIQVRYSEWCGNGERFIDQAYIVYKDQKEYPVVPFLQLPWDYQSKGLSFTDAAHAINSYFDHEYPLLSMSILSEPLVASSSVIKYEGPVRTGVAYSRHDGYDWGKMAKASYGESVLAAADGIATYITSCKACGNAIYIDHGNGYQTRYYHMQNEGLIIATPGATLTVKEGQQIGKVGATGNVRPAGEAGAHLHFMIVQDKNEDGNFSDNIPDGVTDPFGWDSKEPDPWESYEFTLSKETKTGNKSIYLWKDPVASSKSIIPKTGGTIIVNGHKITFPSGYMKDQGIVEIKSTPVQTITESLRGINGGLSISVIDIFGNAVRIFPQPFTLIWDYSKADLSNTDATTLSLYSSSDGITWTKETTQLDLANKKATAQLNHLTEFALAGEIKDTTPPTTQATLVNDQSPPRLVLTSQDNDEGIGVDYTLYKINENDWEKYDSPVSLQGASSYEIQFYSVDKGENIEDIKTQTINLDSTPPTTNALVIGDEGDTGWYRSAVTISLAAQDNEDGLGVKNIQYKVGNDEWKEYITPLVFDTAGEYIMTYYATDNGENKEEAKTIHFFIDKTPPEAEISFNTTNYMVEVTGKDENGTDVIVQSLDKNKYQYSIQDKAGNTLKLILLNTVLLDSVYSSSIQSLEYNGNITAIDKNVFISTIIKNLKTKKLISIGQVYAQRDNNIIGERYTVLDNKTRIFTYDKSNKELLKEIVAGMRLLKVYTEVGTLKYRY